MSDSIVGLPGRTEAAPYYYGYIDRVQDADVLSVLESQLDTTLDLLRKISDERSLHRYAPDKWSIREMMSHVNDTERVFVFRALWFARGFTSPLPSFDQEISVRGAVPDQIPWVRHIDEFRAVRLATLAFFRNLPGDAWMRSGIASDNPFTVRALAFIAAGHVSHHVAILNERYM